MIPEKITTLEKHINESDSFTGIDDFMDRWSQFHFNHKPPFSKLKDSLREFALHSEMYVTKKDRIKDRVEKELKVKVKSIIKRKDKYALSVIQGKKKASRMWVKIQKGKYVFGVDNITWGEWKV